MSSLFNKLHNFVQFDIACKTSSFVMDYLHAGAEFVKTVWPLLTVSAAYPVAVVYGIIPKVGFSRAVYLALRSKVRLRTMPLSVRTKEIKKIRTFVDDKVLSQDYMVVVGQKGVGKTCLVRTVAERRCGSIIQKVNAGVSSVQIENDVYSEISGINLGSMLFKPKSSAARVSFWYRFLFGRPLVVVLEASERLANKDYADLPSAARNLSAEARVHVLVDGSPNSIPVELLRTIRQNVCHLNR
jgi:hypothetical protein